MSFLNTRTNFQVFCFLPGMKKGDPIDSDWPQAFTVAPKVGDIVQSRTGVQMEIEKIRHKAGALKKDGEKTIEEPAEVWLHLKQIE